MDERKLLEEFCEFAASREDRYPFLAVEEDDWIFDGEDERRLTYCRPAEDSEFTYLINDFLNQR